MAKLIDLEEIQRTLESRKERIGDAVLGNTAEAVLARHEIEVASPMTIWRTKEINRHTNPQYVINAMLIGAAAALGGEIMQRVSEENRASAAVNMCAEMCGHLLEIISHSNEERSSYSTIIGPKDVGTA